MNSGITLALPVACAWARWQEAHILKHGVPLNSEQLRLAKSLEIFQPEKIHLLKVEKVAPMNRLFRWIGGKLGLIFPDTIGMTLRYGIFIRSDYWGEKRLIIHELAHVRQYERLGGFRGFLRPYLEECIDPGYPFGEMECEAKAAEDRYS